MERFRKIGAIFGLGAVAYGLYRLILADMYSVEELVDPTLSAEERKSRAIHNKTHALLTMYEELKDIQLESIPMDPTAKDRARKTGVEVKRFFEKMIAQHNEGHK